MIQESKCYSCSGEVNDPYRMKNNRIFSFKICSNGVWKEPSEASRESFLCKKCAMLEVLSGKEVEKVNESINTRNKRTRNKRTR